MSEDILFKRTRERTMNISEFKLNDMFSVNLGDNN